MLVCQDHLVRRKKEYKQMQDVQPKKKLTLFGKGKEARCVCIYLLKRKYIWSAVFKSSGS